MCTYKRLYTIYCHSLIASPILPRAAFQLIKHTFQTTLCGSSQFMFPTSKWKGLVDRLDILHIYACIELMGKIRLSKLESFKPSANSGYLHSRLDANIHIKYKRE